MMACKLEFRGLLCNIELGCLATVINHLRLTVGVNPDYLTFPDTRCIFIVDTIQTIQVSSTVTTRVQKWGNSLALRIPKTYAEEAGLAPDVAVDIRLKNGALIITTAPAKSYALDDLLSAVTADNLHSEVDAGPSVGREVW